MAGRRTALAILLLGSAVGLAGCGFSKTIDPVAAAATKTEQAGGYKVAMTVTANTAGQSFTIDAAGTFDQDQGELTMDLSGLPGSAGLLPGSGQIKVLYLKENGDPVMYMDFPFLASRLPGGKAWIRLDLEKAGKSLGVDFNQLLNQSSQNPGQVLDMLKASGDVQAVGPDTVDGVATTEYKGTIDLTKAVKLGGVTQAELQQLIDRGVPTTLPVEVWIGDDGLVRKLDLSEDLTVGGQSASMDTILEISDFGTAVAVSAPPADQVLDLTDLAAQAAQSAANAATPSPTA